MLSSRTLLLLFVQLPHVYSYRVVFLPRPTRSTPLDNRQLSHLSYHTKISGLLFRRVSFRKQLTAESFLRRVSTPVHTANSALSPRDVRAAQCLTWVLSPTGNYRTVNSALSLQRDVRTAQCLTVTPLQLPGSHNSSPQQQSSKGSRCSQQSSAHNRNSTPPLQYSKNLGTLISHC